jgi:tRNA pseudouridine38-40 synthase
VLVEVGRGQLNPDETARWLREPSEWPARLTAPASGLFLERVYYTGDPREQHVRPITPLRSR